MSNSKSDACPERSRRACPEYSARNPTPSDYEEEGEDEEVSKDSIH